MSSSIHFIMNSRAEVRNQILLWSCYNPMKEHLGRRAGLRQAQTKSCKRFTVSLTDPITSNFVHSHGQHRGPP